MNIVNEQLCQFADDALTNRIVSGFVEDRGCRNSGLINDARANKTRALWRIWLFDKAADSKYFPDGKSLHGEGTSRC